ncbi:AbfB domain-containing protein [Actinosynnema sp. CA-248983]
MTRPDRQSLNGEWEFLNPATDAAGNVDRYAVCNSPDDGSALFRADATFCARPGVGGTGVTFESINLPGSYLRHFNAAVYIASGDGTDSNRPQTLTADSSRAVAPPWTP